ncbi:MAG: BatA domain-containing protein [Jejuia sp.]
MQFKNPELLYALFLLVIPIIVHLFQLRKFKKVPFTNVAFLKNVAIKTRKSAQLKKWLTLITRILLFAAIILAFAQPYFSKKNSINQTSETVIYLDNSFSMQAKGDKGVLLKRAIQDIISYIPEEKSISILTNSETYKNTSIAALKNSLLQLPYASNQLSLNKVLLKSESIFSKKQNTLKNLILISDFQNTLDDFQPVKDSLLHIYSVKLNPTNSENVAVDSAYISNTNPTKIQLTVSLKNSGKAIDNLPVSLYNNKNLIAKTSTAIQDEAIVAFDLPNNEIINGEIVINDTHLTFDNKLYFNINAQEKVNVLAISASETDFLKRIYSEDEFNFTSSSINNLNYSDISQQNLIVLHELERIPNALIPTLKSFTDNGGTLLTIPASSTDIDNYNTLLSSYNLGYNNLISFPKRITKINFSHPLYNNGVFEKRVTNFQYPKVESFFDLNTSTSSILSFEDGKSFLVNRQNTFLFTAAINNDNSNFKQSPLIVPTLYNIGKYSYNIPQLYYTIGIENSYEVKTNLRTDGVLSLKGEKESIIPRQQNYTNKVEILTDEIPNEAGIYTIANKEEIIANVSYNYDRSESQLNYQNIEGFENIKTSDSISALFETLKSDTQINALWKWFVIFALIMLILEMLILKYFK